MTIKKIYLELTDRCNLNCSICYRKSWNNVSINMDKKILYKIYEELKNMRDLKSIVFGGIGEPTFSPLIYEAIETFKDYHLTITTNGTLMNEKLLDIFIKYVDVIVVSIDGLKDNFKNIRGIELNNIIGNLVKLNKLKEKENKPNPIINIQFVASKDNIDDIFNVIDLASFLKVNTVIISNLLPQTEENVEKILYKRYENKKMKNLINKVRNYSFRKGLKLITPNYELKTERRCDFIENDTTYITVSGDVVPCYRLSHRYKEYVFGREKWVDKYSFGNIMENSLEDIWNSKAYSQFRKTIYYNLYPSCIDCDLVEGCDMVKSTEVDCYGISPSCADCLWARKFVICP